MANIEQMRAQLIHLYDQRYQKLIRRELDKSYPVDKSKKTNKSYADSILSYLTLERELEIGDIKKASDSEIRIRYKLCHRKGAKSC
ncbi:hypothetical protein IKD67_03970 [Candidatus Saccharibacteria bacterium]|nr:hypothetical protein [Candidatus Saccharibacteria bacterium]